MIVETKELPALRIIESPARFSMAGRHVTDDPMWCLLAMTWRYFCPTLVFAMHPMTAEVFMPVWIPVSDKMPPIAKLENIVPGKVMLLDYRKKEVIGIIDDVYLPIMDKPLGPVV